MFQTCDVLLQVPQYQGGGVAHGQPMANRPNPYVPQSASSRLVYTTNNPAPVCCHHFQYAGLFRVIFVPLHKTNNFQRK